MRHSAYLRRFESAACGALLLVGAAQAQVTVSFPQKHNVVTLTVPGKAPALRLDLHELNIEENSLSRDAAARRILASAPGGFTLTAFVVPAREKGDGRHYRDYSWKHLQKAPFKREQVRMFERGEVAFLEYIVEEFEGRRVHQKNVFAYLASGDVWMDVHISKAAFEPRDQKLIDSVLGSISVLSTYEPDSHMHFGYGSGFYLRKEWGRAAEHYEKALALEKQKRVLPRDEWRVLVDNLGMAYGMSGNMAKAKTVFEYGLSQEPTYPMFHYNLACAHAEMGDVENALKSLTTAFQYKHNSIRGEEGMPDPRQDSSFKGLLASDRFQALAKSVCPASRKTPRGYICQP